MGIGSVAGVFSGSGGGMFVGGSIVRLLLDSAQFTSGLRTSEARLHGFGRKVTMVGRGMQRLGAGLTRNVTVPIVAAGAASVKMAVDFESAFVKIRANSNLTNKEITDLRKVVLDLAGKTAKSPQELANGLYFLASAGLNAQQVTETLTASAKASASGFGEVGDIARLTSNVLNAYAKDGIKAAQVTDILAAAVREGTAEPDEFANAMGRILGVAQAAGIGFNEVAASLASLSNIGLDVNEGVTAMRGLILALLSPTEQARDTLADLGMTADDVREAMSERGLLGTMRLLQKQTRGNLDLQDRLVGNNRSLAGLLGITSQEADKVDAAFKRVADSTGDLDRAFEETRKGPEFRFQQMLARLRVSAIKIGRILLPVAEDIAEGIADVAKAFNSLPKVVRENFVKVAMAAALLGPLLSTLGAITQRGGRLIGMLGMLGKAAPTTVPTAPPGGGGTAVPPVVAGGGLAVAAVASIVLAGWQTKKILDARDEVAAFAAAVEKAGIASKEARRAGKDLPAEAGVGSRVTANLSTIFLKATGGIEMANSALEKFLALGIGSAEIDRKHRRGIAQTVQMFDKLGVAIDEETATLVRNNLKVGDGKRALDLLQGALGAAVRQQRDHKRATDSATSSLDLQIAKTETLKRRLDALPQRKAVDVQVMTHGMANLERLVRLLKQSTTAQTPGLTGVRAHGGPVRRGSTYLVGERGPEVFSPTRNGHITPNDRLGGNGPVQIVGELVLRDGKAYIQGIAEGVSESERRRSARDSRYAPRLVT